MVQRFFLFAASPEASVAQGEAEEVRSASKDKALRYLFSHSSASVECWLELANREAVLLEVLSPDAYAGLQKRATELYERAIAQTERGSGRLPLDEVWAKYLAFLVESKHDMPVALATFQRALHRLQATDLAAAHALETAWHALVDSV